MTTQFFTIGLLMLFSSMLPGPDFALVTKNTLFHSRRAGLFTSLGIGCAILIHITYCALGLAILIKNSYWLFNLIKYIGAAYLIYLGVQSFFIKTKDPVVTLNRQIKKSPLLDVSAFRQGFFCNLLNPKATLFFLALFTMIIQPTTPRVIEIIYAIEMFIIIVAWFSSLTLILSHPTIVNLLDKAEKYIAKLLGIFLIGFGIVLMFVTK